MFVVGVIPFWMLSIVASLIKKNLRLLPELNSNKRVKLSVLNPLGRLVIVEKITLDRSKAPWV